MIIIETCPKCGHDLVDEILTVNPPIPKKSCWNCGWSWTGKQEEVVRIPFGGNSCDDTIYTNISDLISTDDTTNALLKDIFGSTACDGCSNNPKNGGSGICFCTLGSMQVTY